MSTASKQQGSLPRLVITAGEPAGIGPELCYWIGSQNFEAAITVLADIDALKTIGKNSRLVTHTVKICDGHASEAQRPGKLSVLHHPLAQSVTPGQPDSRNAAQVLSLLDTAMQGCESGHFDAMVTAPLQKSVINDAGIAFTGHTEYLADYFKRQTVMLLAAGNLRVALATTHMPLADVPKAITATGLTKTLRILQQELQQKWGLEQPNILVCGLNPHAGEAGHLGREEIEIITPVLEQLRTEGMRLQGPLPADTLFVPHHLAQADAVLAMYHDQGLPVLKHIGFGNAVNITLGLPIVRSSVDHGTALDRVGSAHIDTGSMKAAILSAIEQCQARSYAA